MNAIPQSFESLEARLDAALRVAGQAKSRIVSVTVAAPPTRASGVFANSSDESAYYFSVGDKSRDTGIGVAAKLEADHVKDLPSIGARSQELLEHVLEIGIDAAAHPPRFYGGMAYDRAPEPRGPWREFSRVRFDLPRFRYRTDGQRATLTLCVLPGEIAESQGCASWTERTLHLLSTLALPTRSEPQPSIRRRTDHPAAKDFLRSVSKATRLMRGNGGLEKVVLAREVVLELDHAPRVAELLDSLDALSPETTRFAFRRGASVFLGATPERLVSRFGSELRTEAVAGSARALDIDAAERLLASEKERYEHTLVVRELCRKLEELGARPCTPGPPSIRQLRHVLHLATSITARLFGPPHVLTLVNHLHPTPAVGGVPDQLAAAFMKKHEQFERGWYAAPVGWFDGLGDGEFVVALRSGLLAGNIMRLFAGAGIVRDSEPDAEYRETELKLQSLLEALCPRADNQSAANTIVRNAECVPGDSGDIH